MMIVPQWPSLSFPSSHKQAGPVNKASPTTPAKSYPCPPGRLFLGKAATAQSTAAHGVAQPASPPSSWSTLNDMLVFQNMHNAPVSSLLTALMQAHALSGAGSTWAPVQGSNLNPTQLLLPRLLDCQQEVAALRHLLVAPSPWQPLESGRPSQQEDKFPKQQEALSEHAVSRLYEDLWDEHDEAFTLEVQQQQQPQWMGGSDLEEHLELLSQHRRGQHEYILCAQEGQGTHPLSPRQQLQQIKEALGLNPESHVASALKKRQGVPQSAHHSLRSNNSSAQSGHRSLSGSINSEQRLCVLQLSQAALRSGMALQAEEAAACALLLAQLALSSGLLSPGTHHLHHPSPGSTSTQPGAQQWERKEGRKELIPLYMPARASEQWASPAQAGGHVHFRRLGTEGTRSQGTGGLLSKRQMASPGAEGGVEELQQGRAMRQAEGVVQQAVLMLVQRCLDQMQRRLAGRSSSKLTYEPGGRIPPAALRAAQNSATTAARAAAPPLVVLAAAAAAAALCSCSSSAQHAQPVQGARSSSDREMTSAGSQTSSTSGDSTSSDNCSSGSTNSSSTFNGHTSSGSTSSGGTDITSSGSTSSGGTSSGSTSSGSTNSGARPEGCTQEGTSVAWWWDVVRQLSGALLGADDNESGSVGILSHTGSASRSSVKDPTISVGSGDDGGGLESGGLDREDGEVLAMLLWSLGKARVDLGDQKSRPWTRAVLLHLQHSAPSLSHSALLDVLWALYATNTLPHTARLHSSAGSTNTKCSIAGQQKETTEGMAGEGHASGVAVHHHTESPPQHQHQHQRNSFHQTDCPPLQYQQQQQQQQQCNILQHPQSLMRPKAPDQHQQVRQGHQHTPPSFPLVLPPEDHPPWLAALLRELTKRRSLAVLTGKQLVGLLVVLTQAQIQLERRATGRVLSSLHSRIIQGCPSLSAHQLSLAMWALAKTRTSLKAQMMHSLLDRFREQLPKASVADVASLVWAIPLVSKHYTKWLTVQHDGLLRALADFTLPHLTTCAAQERGTSSQQPCGPRQLVQLAVGFTRLHFYPGAEWMRWHRAASIAVQHVFTSLDRAQIRAAYQTLLEV